MLARFLMKYCKPIGTPTIIVYKLIKEYSTPLFNTTLYRSLVGSLKYLIATQIDIILVVNLIVWFIYYPHESHYKASKRILWYISNTKYFILWCNSTEFETLEAYAYVDLIEILDDKKSTSGHAFLFSESLI